MQYLVIGMLLFSVLIAGATYYSGFYRPTRFMVSRAQAAFFTILFMLVPVLILTLWLQSNANDTLAKTGFVPFPGTQESSGLAITNPNWVFHTQEDRAAVFEFYRDKTNRPGWRLTGENKMMMVFRRGNETMVIGFSSGESANTLIYTKISR